MVERTNADKGTLADRIMNRAENALAGLLILSIGGFAAYGLGRTAYDDLKYDFSPVTRQIRKINDDISKSDMYDEKGVIIPVIVDGREIKVTYTYGELTYKLGETDVCYSHEVGGDVTKVFVNGKRVEDVEIVEKAERTSFKVLRQIEETLNKKL